MTLPPTYTFSSLFGTVHCPFSPRELAHTSPVHPNPWHDSLCHHKPHYIFPQNSHHTYLQGISIAFTRYIAMQHPSSNELIFQCHTCFCLIVEPHASWALPLSLLHDVLVSLHILLHWQRHTFAYIMIVFSFLYVEYFF